MMGIETMKNVSPKTVDPNTLPFKKRRPGLAPGPPQGVGGGGFPSTSQIPPLISTGEDSGEHHLHFDTHTKEEFCPPPFWWFFYL